MAWLLGAVACLGGAVWLLLSIDDVTGEKGADWKDAAARMEMRLGTGEMIVVHRPGNVWYADALDGLPAVCDPGRKGPGLETMHADAVWIVGAEKIDRKLKKLLKQFKAAGKKRYGSVHLYHSWKRKSKNKGRK